MFIRESKFEGKEKHRQLEGFNAGDADGSNGNDLK